MHTSYTFGFYLINAFWVSVQWALLEAATDLSESLVLGLESIQWDPHLVPAWVWKQFWGKYSSRWKWEYSLCLLVKLGKEMLPEMYGSSGLPSAEHENWANAQQGSLTTSGSPAQSGLDCQAEQGICPACTRHPWRERGWKRDPLYLWGGGRSRSRGSLKIAWGRTCLVVQWLRLDLSVQGVLVQSPGGELGSVCLAAKISRHKKEKRYCNKFNKDFENGTHQKEKKNIKKKAWGVGEKWLSIHLPEKQGKIKDTDDWSSGEWEMGHKRPTEC